MAGSNSNYSIILDAILNEESIKKQLKQIQNNKDTKLKIGVTADGAERTKKELDGVAFDSSLGEFLFASAFTEGVVSREELFLDILTIALESKDVKHLIVLSFDEEYGDEVLDKLNQKDLDKSIVQFRMREPQAQLHFKWDMLVFPLMKAFGIESSEIN